MKRAYDESRLMPREEEIERVVLGTIILEQKSLLDVIDILTPDSFYNSDHKEIYRAVLDLHNESREIDILTVIKRLETKGLLGKPDGVKTVTSTLTPYYITQLTNRVSSSAHIEAHARIIKEAEIKRTLIMSGHNAVNSAFHPGSDVFEVLDQFQSAINGLTLKMIKGREVTTTRLFASFEKKVEKIYNNKSAGKMIGIPTGLSELDRLLAGWQSPDLVIVAARPGMGKTAFTKRCMYGAIEYLRKPVAVFSLEMSKEQLVDRIVSEEMGIPVQDINNGKFTPEMLAGFRKQHRKFYDDKGKELLIIDDTPGLTINELRARAKRIDAEHDPCLYIVDYLQLLSSSNPMRSNREQDISEMSRGLKALAKELNKPLIALSQLSRACESRPDKIPQLSDLRESGAIEQDADIVIFLFRPEYYRFETVELNGIERPAAGVALVIVAKHRNGELDAVPVRFVGKHTQFTNLDDFSTFAPQVMYDGHHTDEEAF